ncbi:MAG: signal peptide peptidase SppA [Nitrospirota bacterium]
MAKRHLILGIVATFFLIILFFIVTYSISTIAGKKAPVFSDRVALIRVEGIILDSRETIEQLKRYGKDNSVKAIVLRVDSPGGGVVPSQEIYEEVKKIREKGEKKVVVSMGSVAASGGYYIACPADKIVANPGSITGSIGVIMELANIEGLLEKIGVKSIVIKSGRHKDIGSVMREMSAEEKEILQKVLDDVHNQFVEAVANGRGINEDEVRNIADGRIFTGRQAKEMGLVDEIGNLEDTIKLAAQISGIKGEPKVVSEDKRPGFLELFLGDILGRKTDTFKKKVSFDYLFTY